MKLKPKPETMINYKLKISQQELKYFSQSLRIMFSYAQKDAKIEVQHFWNISVLIKRTLDKLFKYNFTPHNRCTFLVNINEHISIIHLWCNYKNVFNGTEQETYYENLYRIIFAQLDKERMEAEHRQKVLSFNPAAYLYST